VYNGDDDDFVHSGSGMESWYKGTTSVHSGFGGL